MGACQAKKAELAQAPQLWKAPEASVSMTASGKAMAAVEGQRKIDPIRDSMAEVYRCGVEHDERQPWMFRKDDWRSWRLVSQHRPLQMVLRALLSQSLRPATAPTAL